jgi:hypothetical protein
MLLGWMSWAFSVVTCYGMDERGLIPGGGKELLHFAVTLWSVLLSVYCLIQRVPGSFSEGLWSDARHFHLLPTFRMCGVLLPLPNASSWRGVWVNKGITICLYWTACDIVLSARPPARSPSRKEFGSQFTDFREIWCQCFSKILVWKSKFH